MSQSVSVALIPNVSGREYVLVGNHIKPFQQTLSDYETHICMDDLDKLYETNEQIFQHLKAMQKCLSVDGRLYQMLKTYRSRCRTVQQVYRKWKKGEAEPNQITHAAYLVLRGIPFHPETQSYGWLIEKKCKDMTLQGIMQNDYGLTKQKRNTL